MQGLTSSKTPRAASKAIILMLVGMTLLLAVHLCYTYPSLGNWKIPTNLAKESSTIPNATAQTTTQTTTIATPTPNKEDLPCQKLTGGEDVLVVMRTGATEIKDKLPAHLSTTFKCYPNTLILSDYAENFHGHKVHDVLSDIDEYTLLEVQAAKEKAASGKERLALVGEEKAEDKENDEEPPSIIEQVRTQLELLHGRIGAPCFL